MKNTSQIDRLKQIVETLRSEEEAAEVIGGINILEETGDAENLKEELGDLLLQVMFHSVIAEEEGLFTFEDVAKTVADKMERRHPHVFTDVKFETEEELHAAWAEIKRKEKEGKEWHADYLPGAFKEAHELIDRAQA